MAVLDGTHTIYHGNPTVSFYAMMYGQVIYESYGFPAGRQYFYGAVGRVIPKLKHLKSEFFDMVELKGNIF